MVLWVPLGAGAALLLRARRDAVAQLEPDERPDFFTSLSLSLAYFPSFGLCEQVDIICERFHTSGGTLSSNGPLPQVEQLG
jgi:hypothetical protein